MAQKSLSYQQYRGADLTIFAVVFCALDAAITLLAKQWVDTLYYVSLLYVMAALVIMRWGGWGVLHCALGAVVQCAAIGADMQQYIAYIVGNCFVALVLLFRHFVGAKKVRDSFWLTALFVVIIYLSICLGRTVMLCLLKGQNFVQILLQLVATDVLSLVIALVMVLISRKQNGLFEDQKQYLLRTEKEREKQLRHSNIEE